MLYREGCSRYLFHHNFWNASSLSSVVSFLQGRIEVDIGRLCISDSVVLVMIGDFYVDLFLLLVRRTSKVIGGWLIAYPELFYKRLFYGGWSVGITLIF